MLGQLFAIPRCDIHFSIFHLLLRLLRSFRAISFRAPFALVFFTAEGDELGISRALSVRPIQAAFLYTEVNHYAEETFKGRE